MKNGVDVGGLRPAGLWLVAMLAVLAMGVRGAPARAADAPLTTNDPTRATAGPTPAPAGSAPLQYTPPLPPVSSQDTQARFVLHSVTFDGATEVPPSALVGAWAGFRDKPVSLADLRTIGRQAEGVYAHAGYPFVAIVLKVQEVDAGEVHYSVIEGRISDLTVLGSSLAARRQASAMLEPLVNRPRLSLADVDRAYQLTRLIPGLSTSGTLRQGSQAGGMDLVIAAQRSAPVSVYVNVNNLYANSVGPWGVLVGADYRGESRYGDQASAQVYAASPFDRQVLVRGSYSRGLNSEGTKITVSGLWGEANPDEADASQIALANDVATVRAEISQPILERHDANIVAAAGIELNNQRTRYFSNQTLKNDQLRVFTASLAWEQTGAIGRWSGSLELRQGLDIADASQPGDHDLSRLGGDPQATIAKLSLEAQSISINQISFAARADFQYAADRLEAPDQYAVGNLAIGRGYQPGSALGDDVAAGSLEARYGPIPVKFGQTAPLQLQPFVFVDTAWLYNRGVGSAALTSLGGGLRLQMPGEVEMDLTVAEPLDAPPGLARPGPTVLLNLTCSLDDAFSYVHRHMVKEASK